MTEALILFMNFSSRFHINILLILMGMQQTEGAASIDYQPGVPSDAYWGCCQGYQEFGIEDVTDEDEETSAVLH
jgi:hypothetical protein